MSSRSWHAPSSRLAFKRAQVDVKLAVAGEESNLLSRRVKCNNDRLLRTNSHNDISRNDPRFQTPMIKMYYEELPYLQHEVASLCERLSHCYHELQLHKKANNNLVRCEKQYKATIEKLESEKEYINRKFEFKLQDANYDINLYKSNWQKSMQDEADLKYKITSANKEICMLRDEKQTLGKKIRTLLEERQTLEGDQRQLKYDYISMKTNNVVLSNELHSEKQNLEEVSAKYTLSLEKHAIITQNHNITSDDDNLVKLEEDYLQASSHINEMESTITEMRYEIMSERQKHASESNVKQDQINSLQHLLSKKQSSLTENLRMLKKLEKDINAKDREITAMRSELKVLQEKELNVKAYLVDGKNQILRPFQDENRTLCHEISGLRKIISENPHQLQEHKEQNQKLQAEINQCKDEVDSLNRQLKHEQNKHLNAMKLVDTEVQDQKQVVKKLQQKSVASEDEYQRKVKELDEENQRLQNDLSNKEAVLMELKAKEKTNQLQSVQRIVEENKLLQQENDSLKSLKIIASDLEKGNHSLEQKCEENDKLLNDFQKLQKQWKEENCSLQVKTQVLEAEIGQMKSSTGTNSNKQNQLNDDLSKTRKFLFDKDKTIKDLETQIQGLQSEVQRYKAEAESLKRKMKKVQKEQLDEMKVIQDEVKTQKQVNELLEQKLQGQINQIRELNAENQGLQSDLRCKEAVIKELKATERTISGKLQSAQAIRLQNELSYMEAENQRLQNELSDKDTENRRLHNELSGKDSENQQLRNDLSDKDTENCRLSSELSRKDTENQWLQIKLKGKEALIKELKASERTSAEENQLLKQEIDSLKQQASTYQANIDQYKRTTEKLNHQLQMVEREFSNKEQHLLLLAQKDRQIEELSKRLDSLNQRFQKELSGKDREMKRLQNDFGHKEAENLRLHNELSDKDTENQQLQTKLRGKETVINELKSCERTITGKLQSAQATQKENQVLKQEIDSLKQQACQREDTERKKTSTYQANIDQYKRTMEELSRQLKEVQQESSNNEQFLSSLARKDRQIEELSKRLATEMSTKVSLDERALENVCVKNRPMNIAAEYEMICSNEWHDAKNELDKLCPQMTEDGRVKLLMSVFEVSENEARQKMQVLISQFHTMISAPFTMSKSSTGMSSGVTTIDKDANVFIGDKLRCNADNADMTSMCELVKKKIGNLPYSTRTNQKLYLFIDAAARVTWKMVLQRPPMCFSQDGTGEKWQGENKQELCWNSSDPHNPSSKVKYYVHPALYHGESLMVKGRVMLANC